MGHKVTIIMYHFVRDLDHSRYPEIKGLRVSDFKEQLGYIEKHYKLIRMEEVIATAYSEDYSLPPNAALLTFDDGYVDHFMNVFPILNEKGIQGTFFPPAKAILEKQVLDVNKIHFILASVGDKQKIIDALFSMLEGLKHQYPLQNKEYYIRKVLRESRFDTKEVTFIKAMLQKELPEGAREKIIASLFANYVTEDEGAFSRELYMTVDQIMCMKRNGMFIGSHAYNHQWLGTLDTESQEREIDLSLAFLSEIASDLHNWVMCYPYGSYNESLLSILHRKGCKIGLTVHVDIAELQKVNPLTLPRLDTNDLPKQRSARPNEWTLQAIGWQD